MIPRELPKPITVLLTPTSSLLHPPENTASRPGLPRRFEVARFDIKTRNRPNSNGEFTKAIGAKIKWLPPYPGDGPVATYEVSTRLAQRGKPVTEYSDDDVDEKGNSAWLVSSSRIPSNKITEAAQNVFYWFYVPRLTCGGHYIFRLRGYTELGVVGPSSIIDVELPKCPTV